MADWPVVVEFPELVADSDLDLWEQLRPQIVVALEAKLRESEQDLHRAIAAIFRGKHD